MEEQIAFESEDEPILIGLSDGETQAQGRVKISAGTGLEKARQTLSDSLDSIKKVADGVNDKLQESNRYPDEVTVEFGINIAVEAGAIIAKTSGEGHIKLTLKWKKG